MRSFGETWQSGQFALLSHRNFHTFMASETTFISKRRAIAVARLTIGIKRFGGAFAVMRSLRVCASGKDKSQNRIRRIAPPSGRSYTPRHSDPVYRAVASVDWWARALATARGKDSRWNWRASPNRKDRRARAACLESNQRNWETESPRERRGVVGWRV